MGVKIFDLINSEEIDLSSLCGKAVAVDSSLFLYQFLSTIRQRDGTPLMDSKGRVTSHLTGLFSRSVSLMEKGIKLAYVFDGEPPQLKKTEKERRKELKAEAEKKYKIAAEQGNVEEMKKYASRTSRLTGEMVREAKELVAALGLPVVQAPSEGEAQAAFMVKNGDAYAVASQDADAFLFGATRVVRNLAITGKRKMPNKLSYETVKPELAELGKVLNSMGIDHEQLIALSMLVGTDYNIGGIKGIGPKKALALVKKHGKDFDSMFEEAKWGETFEFLWTEVFYLIKNIPTTKEYRLEWKDANEEEVIRILVKEHDFSEERVKSSLSRLQKKTDVRKQKGLSDWIG